MSRCPACGATNPPNADWCGQCFTSLVVAETPARPAPAPRAVVTLPTPTGSARDLGGTGFRQRDGRLEWECVTCGTYQDMDLSVCAVCETPFGARMADSLSAHSPAEHHSARMRSAVLPGLGHLRLGEAGTGIARMVLFVVWVLGGVALAVSGRGGLLAAVPLLLGAGVVHALSMLDLSRLRAGEPPLLAGRTLLVLVVVVTLGTLGALLVAAITAGPALGPG